MSTICHASKLRERAKAVVFRLKTELPRQQFAIAIQAPGCSIFQIFVAVVPTCSWSPNFLRITRYLLGWGDEYLVNWLELVGWNGCEPWGRPGCRVRF